MKTLDADITAHNTAYVDRVLERDKVYFDNILKQIDPNIQLDEEQRRAVITDDDYCLLVAGAGKDYDDGCKSEVSGREKAYRPKRDYCNLLYE